MSMQRSFIQLIFALVASFALLGGCASDGTSGTSGSDGTIAVPSADSDLTLTLSQKDMDNISLQMDIHVKVEGLDNETVDSRLRYYVYEATSATAKYGNWDQGTASTVLSSSVTSQATGNDIYSAAVIDPRRPSADNITLDTVGGANSVLSSKTVTHMIIVLEMKRGMPLPVPPSRSAIASPKDGNHCLG